MPNIKPVPAANVCAVLLTVIVGVSPSRYSTSYIYIASSIIPVPCKCPCGVDEGRYVAELISAVNGRLAAVDIRIAVIGVVINITVCVTTAYAKRNVLSDQPVDTDRRAGGPRGVSLDAFTRMEMQEELMKLWIADPFTTIFVTHDVEEAVYLADRIVVMTSRPGRLKTIVPVPLSRPRVRTDYDFVQIRNHVLKQYERTAVPVADYSI